MNFRLASALFLVLASSASSLELSGTSSMPIWGIYYDEVHIKVSGEYQVKWKFWTLYNEPVREAIAAVRFTPGSGKIEVGYQKWVSLPDHILAKIAFKDATIGVSRFEAGHILMMDVGVHAAPCVSQAVSSSCWGFNTPGSPAWENLSLAESPGLRVFRVFPKTGNNLSNSDMATGPNLQKSTRQEVIAFVKDPELRRSAEVVGARITVDVGAARAFLAGLKAASKDSLARKIESDLRKSDSLEAVRLRRAAKTDTNFWNQPSGTAESSPLTTYRISKQAEWMKVKEERDQFRKDSARASTAWQATIESQRLRFGELKIAAARGLQVSKRHPLQCTSLEKFVQRGGIAPKGTFPSNSYVLVDSATGQAIGTEGYYSCNSGVNFVQVNRYPSGSNSSGSLSDNQAIVDHTGRVVVGAAPQGNLQVIENQYAFELNKNDVSIWNLQEGKRMVGPIQKAGEFWQTRGFGDMMVVDLGEKGRVFKVLLDGSVSQIDTKRCGHYNVVRRFRYFDMNTGKDVGGTEEARVESPFCLSAS